MGDRAADTTLTFSLPESGISHWISGEGKRIAASDERRLSYSIQAAEPLFM
jgi:hypothetical protein